MVHSNIKAGITYRDVKTSPPWEDKMPNANEPTKNFELALSELIDSYRGKIERSEIVGALDEQTRCVVNDDGWPAPPTEGETEQEGTD